MGATPTFDLYVDDSGSRLPDHPNRELRRDGMDAFALGGVIVAAEDAPRIYDLVEKFRAELDLAYPLHSHKIRSRTQEFAWLGTDKTRADKFYAGIENLVTQMPGFATACVVHRPGYNERYERVYGEGRWALCRTAYQILLDRSAKFAISKGRRLIVFVEATGKNEDRNLRAYQNRLLSKGPEFDADQSAKYRPLGSGELMKTVVKNINFIKKQSPLAQAADLVLYPIVKGRYQPSYPPFRTLCDLGKVIDYALPSELEHCGIKYSCFDGPGFEETLFKKDKRPSVS